MLDRGRSGQRDYQIRREDRGCAKAKCQARCGYDRTFLDLIFVFPATHQGCQGERPRVRIRNGTDAHVAIADRSADCGSRPCRDRNNRCRLRHVHRGSCSAAAVARGNMEQHLVFAVVLCGDQLHPKLDLRGVCCGWLLGRRICEYHSPSPNTAATRTCAALNGPIWAVLRPPLA